MGGGKPGGLIRTTASTRRRIREPIGIRTGRVGTPAGGKRCGDKGVARRTSRLAPTSTGSQSPAWALADCHRCRAAGWGCHVTADGDAPDPGGAFARLRIGARRSAASCRGCCAGRRADARRRVYEHFSTFAREPIEPVSRLGRGVQLHGEKDFQQALQQLLVAAQSDPNDPRVYVYLADTYRWLGMDAESNAAAERAKQLDPNAFDILR